MLTTVFQYTTNLVTALDLYQLSLKSRLEVTDKLINWIETYVDEEKLYEACHSSYQSKHSEVR